MGLTMRTVLQMITNIIKTKAAPVVVQSMPMQVRKTGITYYPFILIIIVLGVSPYQPPMDSLFG